MADNKTVRGPADAKRINIHEDYEIRYWTKKFGCSKEELIACVERVGVMAVDVERCLGQ
jgi:hypothetical protein